MPTNLLTEPLRCILTYLESPEMPTNLLLRISWSTQSFSPPIWPCRPPNLTPASSWPLGKLSRFSTKPNVPAPAPLLEPAPVYLLEPLPVYLIETAPVYLLEPAPNLSYKCFFT